MVNTICFYCLVLTECKHFMLVSAGWLIHLCEVGASHGCITLHRLLHRHFCSSDLSRSSSLYYIT